MENIALYARHPELIPAKSIQTLAGDATVSYSEDQVIVEWPDVKIELNPMYNGAELQQHLGGFQGFVRHQAGDAADELQGLVDLIGDMQLCFGCVVTPDFDLEGKAKSFLISLAATYEQALFFFQNAILSPFGEIWFGPQNMEPLAPDLGELSIRKVMLHETPSMSVSQTERFNRVGALMAKYGVPVRMKRSWVDDDANETIRTPQQVAERIIAMHAVVCIARGRPREETIKDLKASGARHALSPEEVRFLKQKKLPDDEREQMIWRLEDLWLLMWSLRHIDKFRWPDRMCDVDALHDLIFEKAKDPQAFIANAKLRSKKSILDATQIVVQLHAVIRDANAGQDAIPENLNWKSPAKMLSPMQCAACGVVAHRHHALNWLRCHDDCDWDDVDTPTMPYAITVDQD